MKVNEVFKLPLHLDSDVVRDNNNDYIVNMDTTQEDEAVVIAVNHHDELVEALGEIVYEYDANGAGSLSFTIAMDKASNLLDKINGE